MISNESRNFMKFKLLFSHEERLSPFTSHLLSPFIELFICLSTNIAHILGMCYLPVMWDH